ncbi:ISAs1 family transposase, partial [Saccharopolyspora shandongensis]|uniref:ISAs1 family transposase n=1 Tax=Saccharopolyspora shandongensis TaxID=418495 RepID=UPI0033D623A9
PVLDCPVESGPARPAPVVDVGWPVPQGLLEVLTGVADPRKRRGVRHRLAVVLAIALAATLAGACSFTAVAEWATDAPAGVLTRLGVLRRAPSESTIRRVLQRLPGDAFDEMLSAWMWLRTSTISGRRVIAFGGKTVKGAKDTAGKLVHLLSGLCQRTGAVLTQVAVGAKTNEIPVLATLLGGLDITTRSSLPTPCTASVIPPRSSAIVAATTSSRSKATSPPCGNK